MLAQAFASWQFIGGGFHVSAKSDGPDCDRTTSGALLGGPGSLSSLGSRRERTPPGGHSRESLELADRTPAGQHAGADGTLEEGGVDDQPQWEFICECP